MADSAFARHRAAVRARLREAGRVRPGPGSVTWKINREVVVVAGWGRAILLLLAHPAVAAGVHDHSSFRRSLLTRVGRLRATVRAMQALAFGETEQMIAAAAGINAIHDRVNGYGPGGLPYSAHDPELLRWVHVTLIDSILLAYEQLVGPLTAAERDQYCLEATIMEPLLGMPDGWLPRTAAQLDAGMHTTLEGGTIVITDMSRALARAVLFPVRWRVAWPVFRGLQVLTIGWVPASIRTAYGFEWSGRDARAFARWTSALRTAVRMLPPCAREWPMARRGQPASGVGLESIKGVTIES